MTELHYVQAQLFYKTRKMHASGSSYGDCGKSTSVEYLSSIRILAFCTTANNVGASNGIGIVLFIDNSS